MQGDIEDLEADRASEAKRDYQYHTTLKRLNRYKSTLCASFKR